MMLVQRIATETTLSNSESAKHAMERMRKVPEHELKYYLVLRDTLTNTSAETRQAITLAQIETDRRTNNQTKVLAITTTLISGAVGLLGVLLGAYLAG